MRSNRCRVAARVFLFLTLLSVLVLLAEGFFYVMLQDWMPYELVWKLPFEMKLDYIALSMGVILIFLVITIWLYAFAHAAKKKDAREDFEDDADDVADLTSYVGPAPIGYAEDDTTGSAKPEQGSQAQVGKLVSVAKIALPAIGGCILGAVVATAIHKRKQTKKQENPLYVMGVKRRKRHIK